MAEKSYLQKLNNEDVVADILQTVEEQGFRLAVVGGNLKLFNVGAVSPLSAELREAVRVYRVELMDICSARQSDLKNEVQARTEKWNSYCVPEKGFEMERTSGVTEYLWQQFQIAGDLYSADRLPIDKVRQAFVRFAKCFKRSAMVVQLNAPKNVTATELQENFESGRFRSVQRECVTPQIEPQPDAFEQMQQFFSISAEEYLTARGR